VEQASLFLFMQPPTVVNTDICVLKPVPTQVEAVIVLPFPMSVYLVEKRKEQPANEGLVEICFFRFNQSPVITHHTPGAVGACALPQTGTSLSAVALLVEPFTTVLLPPGDMGPNAFSTASLVMMLKSNV
jgi:hypothetical protein